MKYKIKSLDLDSAKTSDVSFESIEVKENIKIMFLIYRPKKDRVVYSFTKSRSDLPQVVQNHIVKGTRARLGTNRSLLKLVVLLFLVQNLVE